MTQTDAFITSMTTGLHDLDWLEVAQEGVTELWGGTDAVSENQIGINRNEQIWQIISDNSKHGGK